MKRVEILVIIAAALWLAGAVAPRDQSYLIASVLSSCGVAAMVSWTIYRVTMKVVRHRRGVRP
ncbi:MAG: hypothetical protein JWR80_4923 [Bradyrhizobium sp.]|nr:hypothetical protein [Bradyrhizobium sp.]